MKWALRTGLLTVSAMSALLVLPLSAHAGGGLSDGDIEGRKCLAEALYYEARDQGWRGMLAVGVVIQNRVDNARYPADLCGVVRQGRYRNGKPVKHQCQFSYYCDGKPERPAEKGAWTMAKDIATLLTTTQVAVEGIEDATHYHAVWVEPSWAAKLARRQQIGGHVFYAQR